MRVGRLVILGLSLSAVVLAEEEKDVESTGDGNAAEEEEEDMDSGHLKCERPIDQSPIIDLEGWEPDEQDDSEFADDEPAHEEEEEDENTQLPRKVMRKLYAYMNADGDKLQEEEVWKVINNLKPNKIPWDQRLGELDTDKDKRVSMSELLVEEKYKITTDFGKKKFRAADENNDGALNMEEWIMLNNPWKSPKLTKVIAADMMKRLNKNDDEGLSFREWSAEIEAAYEPHELKDLFQKLDTDYDDILDEEELIAWESKRWFFRLVVMRLFEADYRNDGLTLEEFMEGRDVYVQSEAGTFLEGLLEEIGEAEYEELEARGPKEPIRDEL